MKISNSNYIFYVFLYVGYVLSDLSGLEPRPNIVLIIADDVSLDFSCYDGQVDTPNIDQLARKGLLFNNAYVTASSCSPSRNSIITGRYPHNSGAPELHMPLPEGQFMFPKALKNAGYHTVLSGKWHMGEQTRMAFDIIDAAHYPDDPTGSKNWIKWLKERPVSKPFFLWYAAFDAHRPWESDMESEKHDFSKVILPVGIPDTEIARADFASYCDEVRRFDMRVGAVVNELKIQKVLENTLIIVMADNGRPFPRSKTTLYDSGMKTPMIMHWPSGGFKTNVMVDALVSSVDLAPTILEITGLPLHHRLQGRSMIPICHDPEAEIRKFIFGERNWHVQRGCGRLVRNGDWVYIRDFTPNCFSFQMVNHKDGAYSELLRLRSEGVLSSVEEATFSTDRPRELLFNVRKDIDQLDNLVDHAEYKNILAFMRLELKKWQSTTGDTIPDINQMTPDRHDRHTFKRLFFEGRPGGGVIAGQESNAANISN